MIKVSFVLDGKTVSDKQFSNLLKLKDSATKLNVEFIIYSFQKNTNNLPSHIFVPPTNTNAEDDPLVYSLFTARGKWVVLAPIDTIINHLPTIVSSIKLNDGLAICSKLAPNTLHKLLGVRNISSTKYICFDRKFLVSNFKRPNFEVYALKRADLLSAIKFLPPSVLPKGTDPYFSNQVILWRPTTKILKRKLRSLKKRALAYINNMFNLVKKSITKRRLQTRTPKIQWTSKMPVFIICRDRVEPLKKLVAWIEEEGLKNIIFIDNDSTYKPLLDYLNSTPYKVIWLRKNIGHSSPWSEYIVNTYAQDQPYIVSDPDVIPAEKSHGAIKHFIDLLNKYPKYVKVGFGLKIDDLPDHYELKDAVIAWESQFWEDKLSKDVYKAELDTTFALYRQNTPQTLGPALRTGGKFVARHEPWYINSKNISKEMSYYRSHANTDIGTWGTDKDSLAPIYSNYLEEENNSQQQKI